MKGVVRFDANRWFSKSEKVRKTAFTAASRSISDIAKDIYQKAQKNLKGPHYQPGKGVSFAGNYPVPRVSGDLARSLKIKKFNPVLWAVFADSQVANYAKFIHEGTKGMRPRRFIGDVVTGNKILYLGKLKKDVLTAIRGEGRK